MDTEPEMNRVLLVNLKRNGDIYQTAHLINSIYKNDPTTEIGLVVFDEFKTAAKTLSNVSKVYSIPRKDLITFYKNDLYSDGFGIDLLHHSLNKIVEKNWNEVINYSNDRSSTYISTYLATKMNSSLRGIAFTKKRTIDYSNEWSLILNDIITSYQSTPINFNDCIHQITGIDQIVSGEKLVSNTKHNETAFANFNKLRESYVSDDGFSKIVGIQVKTSSERKEIPEETLIEALRYFESDPLIIPILLIAPTDEEREIANRINSQFDNKLVSVEADLIALPSVLLNVDLLFTPDTLVKHMADLLDTPCLEISLGPAPLFKQGSINPNSLILSYEPSKRVFSYTEGEEITMVQNLSLTASDLYKCTQAALGTLQTSEIELEDRWCLYRPYQDFIGTNLAPVSGSVNPEFEVRRFLARQLCFSLASDKTDKSINEIIINSIPEKDAIKVLEEEKSFIGLVTKDLLSTLRSLIQTQESIAKGNQFVTSLGELLEKCDDQRLCAIPILYFRAKVESLSTTSMGENFKEVEALLYKLKDDIQRLMSCINELEKDYTQHRTETTAKRLRTGNAAELSR